MGGVDNISAAWAQFWSHGSMKTALTLPDELYDRPFTVAEAVRGWSVAKAAAPTIPDGYRQGDPGTEPDVGASVERQGAALHLGQRDVRRIPPHNGGALGASPEGAAHLNRPHVVLHRMKLYEDEITTVHGIPVTTPERTWLDMAEMLSVDELVTLGTAVSAPRAGLEGRDRPHCAISDLERMIDRYEGKRGIRKARDAIRLISQSRGGQSPRSAPACGVAAGSLTNGCSVSALLRFQKGGYGAIDGGEWMYPRPAGTSRSTSAASPRGLRGARQGTSFRRR